MALQLYSWPQSSGTRISWALEELNMPYEYIEVDREKQEHRSPRYLAINPHGKVPALVDGDQTFFESAAILLHLGEKYGAAKGLWPAASEPTHADALCWTVWATTELGNYMMQYLYHGLDSPVSFKPEDRSKACAEYNRSQLGRCLSALEARLEAHQYMLGAFSLVDVAVASWLLLGTKLGLGLDAHARVAAWTLRCGERPAFQRAH
ncbi:putative Glutathione S-transferase GstB [Burkholderiales bacterium]|jgi:glutathione S-transferase|nr:putative Glutathione S-transferase GstB [Burkholderiales bacterium]